MTTINLASFVVRDSDGSIDTLATVAKFEGVLAQFQVERETELATIGAAVHAVFDQYKGATLNMPALVSLSLQKLNVQAETYKALHERVVAFVHDNAGENGLFRISKGKGGGVVRVCDVPAKK